MMPCLSRLTPATSRSRSSMSGTRPAPCTARSASKRRSPPFWRPRTTTPPADASILTDRQRRRADEPGPAVERLDAGLRPRLLDALGGGIDHRALEAHQLGPGERHALGAHALAAEVARGLHGLGGADQDLLRDAAAERARASERTGVDHGDRPAGLGAA